PTSATPPASSAARALGAALPTSGSTSQGRGARPVGVGGADEQAQQATAMSSERTRMPAVCRSAGTSACSLPEEEGVASGQCGSLQEHPAGADCARKRRRLDRPASVSLLCSL